MKLIALILHEARMTSPMPTVSAQPRAMSRSHLAIVAGVLLLFGVGMGFFLKWVGNTPRSPKPAPTGEHQDEPRKADSSKPGLEDRLDIVADFGEVAPLPAFAATELPA